MNFFLEYVNFFIAFVVKCQQNHCWLLQACDYEYVIFRAVLTFTLAQKKAEILAYLVVGTVWEVPVQGRSSSAHTHREWTQQFRPLPLQPQLPPFSLHPQGWGKARAGCGEGGGACPPRGGGASWPPPLSTVSNYTSSGPLPPRTTDGTNWTPQGPNWVLLRTRPTRWYCTWHIPRVPQSSRPLLYHHPRYLHHHHPQQLSLPVTRSWALRPPCDRLYPVWVLQPGCSTWARCCTGGGWGRLPARRQWHRPRGGFPRGCSSRAASRGASVWLHLHQAQH